MLGRRTIAMALVGVVVSAAALVLAFWNVHVDGGGVHLAPRVHARELEAALAGVRGGWLMLVALMVVFYRRRAALTARAARVRPWLAHAVGGFAEGLSALGDGRRLTVAALASLSIPIALAATYGSALYAFGLGALPSGTT